MMNVTLENNIIYIYNYILVENSKNNTHTHKKIINLFKFLHLS